MHVKNELKSCITGKLMGKKKQGMDFLGRSPGRFTLLLVWDAGLSAYWGPSCAYVFCFYLILVYYF